MLAAFVAFFLWPAARYSMVTAESWPPTLHKGEGGTLRKIMASAADGAWLKGWAWTPNARLETASAGAPTPLSVRYLRFQKWVNVFPMTPPGAEPPGRLPDPPTWIRGDRTKVAKEHGAVGHDSNMAA